MLILGVDNGFSGAVAGYDNTTGEVFAETMPVLRSKKVEIDIPRLCELLRKGDHVFIEKAQTMPKQGLSSSGRYMMAYGIVLGICAALGKPYTLVHPRTWKKETMMDMPKEKAASIIRVEQLFPNFPFKWKKDHGLADAILIAYYGAGVAVAKY